MRRLAICTVCLIMNSLASLSGQQGLDTIQYGILLLGIKTTSFIKNNEYFNPIRGSLFVLPSSLPPRADKSLWIEGYTLTGAFFEPELVYTMKPGITVKAGVHLLKYSGTDRFSVARPTISATYDFSDEASLTIGSFSSGNRHSMFDPHFDLERLYTENTEEGLLFKFRSDKIFNDTWLDWENFIFKGDTTREVFNSGESFRYFLNIIPGVADAEIPVQILFRHYGGQISNAPYPVETFFNLSTGLKLNYRIAGTRYGKAGLEYLYFRNSIIPQRERYAINHGTASWFRFHYDYKRLYFGFYYWKAEDFYAPLGNGIYASIFNIRSEYVEHTRKVLTSTFYYNLIPEKSFEFRFGAEGYYDIPGKRFDYALLMHFSFDRMFKLTGAR